MKKTLITASLLIVTSATFATQTQANGIHWHPKPVYNQYYVGGSLGLGEGANPIANTGVSFGLDAGYRVNSNVSAELGFLRLPNNMAGNSGNATYDYYGTGKISLPLNPTLALFAKAGLAVIHNSNSDNNTNTHLGFAVGTGVTYHFRPHIDLNGEVFGTLGSIDATTFAFLANVAYSFE